MQKKLLLASALLALLASPAVAQQSCCVTTITGNVTQCSYNNCVYVTTPGTVTACCNSEPDEGTLAAWAAKKAVASQLDWLGSDKEIEKYERAKVDELQARVDELCKWAKTLSNHIFARAYADWGETATNKLNSRRATLDKLDVAKSLVMGLPVPPAAAK